LILGAVLMIALATGVGYVVLFDRAERESVNRLVDYVAERTRFESAIFQRTEEAMRAFGQRFRAEYANAAVLADADFDHYFFKDEYGATRLHRRYFDGAVEPDGTSMKAVSAFVGDDTPILSREFRRRLLLTVKLVGEYGPAWADLNLHASFPENAIVIYWPDAPWGLNARHDLRMNKGSVIRATLKSENPDRRPLWSALYYDLTAKRWSITHQLPVDLNGQHLVNPSADVPLTDLMRRVVEDRMPGTSNFIFSKSGYVIANSRALSAGDYAKGQIAVAEVADPVIRGIHRAMTVAMDTPPAGREGRNRGVWVAEVPELDSVVAFKEMVGPDWLFAVAYPRDLLRPAAHEAAVLLVSLGGAILLLFTLVIVVILTRDIARPITLLEAAAEKVGEGAYDVVAEESYPLPESVPNEIGLLAREFRSMTRRVRDTNHNLERIVAARTRDLEEANRKLTELSLVDGLTKARNRRSFDRDLLEMLAIHNRSTEPFALALFDVDHFKTYNDSQGHQKGDEVLREIVAILQRESRTGDHVYRYGGEELAVLFPDTEQGEARIVAQRLVEAVANAAIPHPVSPIGHVSVSAGLCVAEGAIATPEDMIQRADERLYEAKNGGRNQLVG
jgi:diguanylate cyclase (GGDEF)-like protein